jgi:hypothetical protein
MKERQAHDSTLEAKDVAWVFDGGWGGRYTPKQVEALEKLCGRD